MKNSYDFVNFDYYLNKYINGFIDWFKHEKFKWKGVKQFQDNFNINAKPLADNLNQSLIRSGFLFGVTSPRRMLISLAQFDEEKIRDALKVLFEDKSTSGFGELYYISKCEEVKEASNMIKNTNYGSSGQSSVTAKELLFLNNPEKYAPYRLWIAKSISSAFELGYVFNKNHYDSFLLFLTLREQIRERLEEETNFIKMVDDVIDNNPDCYPDKNHYILTDDFIFFVAHTYRDAQLKKEEAVVTKEAERIIVEEQSSVETNNAEPIDPYEGNGKYIFFSYSHKDKEIAFPFIKELSKQYNVWYDAGIEFGAAWDASIAEHLLNASLFMFLVTDNSLKSTNCKDEIAFARDNQIPFINVLEKDINLPSEFRLRYGRYQMCFLHNHKTLDAAIKDLEKRCKELQLVRK